ncbi:hypothetical protein CIL03_08375 [Virgibacillus indicus]|uniref:Uncharacterized protein n=1 Tax=Virgibacillus indicus TaxID=2024554 RepID=A0A265NAK3_9BACI|nr:hypothetical protein [Virgibacillus indicus]OZU89023.1 hypothetical protein CIL03_08375 [Virgibacillus indicus]
MKQKDELKNIQLSTVSLEESKANNVGYGLYKIKGKNKARFCQAIQENLDVIIRTKHLSNSELGFLLSMMPLVQLHSNAIINHKDNRFFLKLLVILEGKERQQAKSLLHY